MATGTHLLTEADILSELVGPDEATMPEEFARAVLLVRFNRRTTGKIRTLLKRNSEGKITVAEKENLDRYLRVGHFIDLLQAKARISLKPATRAKT